MQPSELSLRDFTRQMLDNIDNPSYVQPTFAPYTPTPQHIPMHARYVLPARKEHKVYTIPTMGAPSTMSPEARKGLDAFLSAVDAKDVDEHMLHSAKGAADHISGIAIRADVLQDIAKRNRMEVQDIRDQYKNKDLIHTPRQAIDKLNELKVQEKFLIPDNMAHNMQALISKRNQKVDGKRFKSKMISSATPVLQVWRTR